MSYLFCRVQRILLLFYIHIGLKVIKILLYEKETKVKKAKNILNSRNRR